MKSHVLSAQQVISNAVSEGKVRVTGDVGKLSSYLSLGLEGKSGFIVDGDLDRFANYLLLASAGKSGLVTEEVANGKCGFTIKGDFGLAWSNMYFQSAGHGACGFAVESAVPS